MSEPQLPPGVSAGQPLVWQNPYRLAGDAALAGLELTRADLQAAIADWADFAPIIARLFPETAPAGGQIASPLQMLDAPHAAHITGGTTRPVLIKCDHALPVAGSIKARGGIFELLRHARSLAGAQILGPAARAQFARHRVLVGSTGNLGFSIGVVGLALGFQVEIHMSSDARQWKKDRLRDLGARVVEHMGDYEQAVGAARAAAAADPLAYFVDDEGSRHLFLGYAAAAQELCAQLASAGITPTAAAPLVVYLPCGVGGAPGGIAFGLRHLLGDAVLPVLVEPVAAPCMLLQLASGLSRSVSVREFGLDNRTAADGLAVARASMLVSRHIRALVAAVATVDDDDLFRWLAYADRELGLRIEPSGAAGFAALRPFLAATALPNATHVIWTTGGGLLPATVFDEARTIAAAILARDRSDTTPVFDVER